MSADFNQIMINQQAHSSGMNSGGGGGNSSIAPGNIGVKSDNAIEHINAIANTGTAAFCNVLKGLDQASPCKDINFGLMKPPPSILGGMATGAKAAGIFGARG